MVMVNGVAGVIATISSSPFNYARNRQYSFKASSDNRYPTVWSSLQELQALWSVEKRLVYTRLRIGWGSLRVGLGMAFGDYFFRYFESSI